MHNYGQNPGIYYYVNDHLGTPQQLITATGLVVWQAAYLPYGEAQVRINLVENNLRFPGQYFDAETGLHYNWNRYYDAQTGRYISADPIGLYGGMNVYAYVGGNPGNWVDKEGLGKKRESGKGALDSNDDIIQDAVSVIKEGKRKGLSDKELEKIIKERRKDLEEKAQSFREAAKNASSKKERDELLKRAKRLKAAAKIIPRYYGTLPVMDSVTNAFLRYPEDMNEIFNKQNCYE